MFNQMLWTRSDSRKLRLVYDSDWFLKQYERPEVKQKSNIVLNSKHAQFNRKSDIFKITD